MLQAGKKGIKMKIVKILLAGLFFSYNYKRTYKIIFAAI
jgi:hypothetical protein